jgi:hypothetical protein
MNPKAVYDRSNRARRRAGVTIAPKQPCEFCDSPDARDEAHARGCPTLPPPTFAKLHRLALEVEAGWAEERWLERERAAMQRPMMRRAGA